MTSPMQKFVWGSLVMAGLVFAAPAEAQEPAIALLLDRNAVQANVAPNYFPAVEINTTIADIGVRDALPFFSARVGDRLLIPGGSEGHEGWLAFAAVPAGWSNAGDDDGLENLFYAGPGLGSPDSSGSRISQLGPRADVVPLGPVGLAALVGRTVCGLAYAGELPRSSEGVTLSGANLGLVAFAVAGVTAAEPNALPAVDVQILDVRETCGGTLVPLAPAPAAGQ